MHLRHVFSSFALITGLALAGGSCHCNEPASTAVGEAPTPDSEAAAAIGAEDGAGPGAVAPGKADPSSLGRLRVAAVADFLKYVVKTLDGKEVANGDTNISVIELPAGEYTVTVKPGVFPAVDIEAVVVEVGKQTGVRLTGFGQLRLGAPADFLKYTVRTLDGKEVAKGDTNITINLLPVGTYTVTVTPGAFPAVDLEAVVIEEGKQTDARLTGFGQVTVKGAKDFLKYSLVDGSGKVVAQGDQNITTLLVPVGTYQLTAGDKNGNPVVVEDGKKLNHTSGL